MKKFILIAALIAIANSYFSQVITIGTSTTSTSNSTTSPYKTGWHDGRAQYLIKASELIAAGASAGPITSLAFYVTVPQDIMNNANVRIKHTTLTSLTSFETTGFTTCWSGNHTPSSGWNTHSFATNFNWDGVQNIVVEYCFDNTVWTTTSTIRYTTTSYKSNAYKYTDNSAGCSLGSASSNYDRPNMQFSFASSPMTYVSSTVTQNTNDTYQSETNQQVVGLEINVSGGASAFDLTEIQFDMNGTNNADVSNIKIFCTGTSSIYSAINQFGATTTPSTGTITISGTQTLVDGTNYFWISYDIANDPISTPGNTVDAAVTQIIFNGSGGSYTDMVPSSPAGNRIIQPIPASFSILTDQNAFGKDVFVDPNDNSYVWIGYSDAAGISSGSADFCIIKTDFAGNIIWNKAIGGADSDQAYRAILLSDGNYLIAGATKSYGANDGGSPDYNILVVKLSPTGNILWSREIDDDQWSYDSDYGYALTETSDGGCAIVGVGNGDIDLTKLSSTGAVLVNREIYGPSVSSQGLTIIEASDGNLVIGGEMNGDFYITKLTSSFTKDWDMKWGGANTDAICAVIENSASDYTVIGRSYSYGAGSSDMYAMRFTFSGAASPNVLWTKAIGTSSYDTANDACSSGDGGYVLTGITSGLGSGGDEIYCVKLDGAGNLVWTQVIGNGSNDDEGYGIDRSTDGSYVIQGLSNNPTSKFYMNRIGPNGYTCSSTGSGGSLTTLTAPSINTTFGGNVSDNFGTNTSPSPIPNTGYNVTDVCNSVVLPIELISFSGTTLIHKNLLKWTTASEYNNDFFTLERSRDGSDWEEVGKVNGAGNSSQLLSYSMYDEDPFPLTYYRLRQTDFDGEWSLSQVIALQYNNESNDLSIDNLYPNPANDQFSFNYSGRTVKSEFIIQITNGLGEVVKIESFNGISNTGYLTVSTDGLSSGMYLIEFVAGEQRIVRKLIIQKN